MSDTGTGAAVDDRLLLILRTHGAPLHALLTRLTLREEVAEELMQELFIRLGRSAGFAAAADGVAYASRVAINLAMDWRRKQRREGWHRPLEEAAEPAASDPGGLQRLIEREEVERILDAAAELPELQRQALVLRFVQDRPYREIGVAMGRTAQQARGLCHAAVRRLRRRLRDEPAGSDERQVCDVGPQ